jgi:hypothetical protein
MASAKAKEMHSVEGVGFACAVKASKAIESRRELECLTFVVFKIGEFERGEVHGGQKYSLFRVPFFSVT